MEVLVGIFMRMLNIKNGVVLVAILHVLLFSPFLLSEEDSAALSKKSTSDSSKPLKFKRMKGKQYKICQDIYPFVESEDYQLFAQGHIDVIQKWDKFSLPKWKLIPDGDERYGEIRPNKAKAKVQRLIKKGASQRKIEFAKASVERSYQDKINWGGYEFYSATFDIFNDGRKQDILMEKSKKSQGSINRFGIAFYRLIDGEYDDSVKLNDYAPIFYDGRVFRIPLYSTRSVHVYESAHYEQYESKSVSEKTICHFSRK